MKHLTLALFLLIAQSSFASGDYVQCATSDNALSGSISGFFKGNQAWLELKASHINPEISFQKLKHQIDLGGISSLEIPATETTPQLVAIVVFQTKRSRGGKARVSLMNDGLTVAELDCQ